MEDEETEMDSGEPVERESITLTFPLDPAHRRMELTLREAGIDIESTIESKVQPSVEQAVYQILQSVKYEQSD
jgi:hypothetical protein